MKPKTQFHTQHASGRPLEFNMDDALNEAVRIFSERGFHATSIAELAGAMGFTVGNIYKSFADKRAVFLAALEHQANQRAAELQRRLGETSTGRKKLLATLEFYAEISSGREGRLGCLIEGAAMELTTVDEEIAQRVAAALWQREKLLKDLITQGRADGSLPAGLDVQACARFLLCVLQGLRMVGKTGPVPAEMLAAVTVAMQALA